ncbi:hypothetical protein JOF53_001015 [Crossiella equi]|uniref:Major royal jelly protein n=1 Tax=Crossiella equi TaxID=130796 RepID=A0ABS5A6B5_9PSEU|nr:L-dopachrome tautomerase-related protein [Crossiella equi]MBP2472143.1 hypothetical protein [Crossiella equi]
MKILAVLLAAVLPLPPAPAPELGVAARTHTMTWNSVAVDGHRTFVSGPRWSGATGPAVAVLDRRGETRPFPDAAWNSWRPGQDPARKFVNVNALHHDRRGSLWAVDTGAPDFGGDPLPGGAKLVRLSLATGQVTRVIPFDASVALPGSYIDDIRFRGTTGYLTDAGRPGLIVLDLVTGRSRRVLDNHPSTVAPTDRPLRMDGEIVRGPDGQPLRVHADPLELSPDGRTLHYGPLHGPWSQVPTALLDDPAVPVERLAAAVRPWLDLPPVGGTALTARGDLYYTDLVDHALKLRTADGRTRTLVRDERLHWADAPFLTADGSVWLPVPQLDRVALFHSGQSKVRWPVELYQVL